MLADKSEEDGIWTNYYEHSDFSGDTAFAWLGGSIYKGVRRSYLSLVGLHDAISSFSLNASNSEVRGDMILFQHDRYFGRFTSVRTNPAASTHRTEVTYVGDYINDRTSSFLLVRRFADEGMRALGKLGIKDLIAEKIENIKKIKELRGDPVIVWDMWPTGGDDHPNAPDKRLIEIKVPVVVAINNWFNYDAEIRLWIYLYVSGGDLRGYVSHYGAWVEGGIISGSVLDELMDAIPDEISEIEGLLSEILDLVNAEGPYEAVYLLPGDHTEYDTERYLEGNVEDDVTVVLQKRRLIIPGTQIAIGTMVETVH